MMAGRGKEWNGAARRGKAIIFSEKSSASVDVDVIEVEARQGVDGQGEARRGKEWQGKAVILTEDFKNLFKKGTKDASKESNEKSGFRGVQTNHVRQVCGRQQDGINAGTKILF